MPAVETLKKIAEKATGLARPANKDLGKLVSPQKPRTALLKDDGIIPNHPHWPLILYRGAVRGDEKFDGTGHQCLSASEDFLVIGAYPPNGTYDECTKSEDRKAALKTIPKVARPRKDPVYGHAGPLLTLWRSGH